jgi:DNA-binding MarR family transcriptional regulator
MIANGEITRPGIYSTQRFLIWNILTVQWAGMAKQDSVDMIQRDTARAFPQFDSSAATITGRIRRVNLHLDRAAEELLRTFNITGASLDVLAALFAVGPPYQLTPTDLYRGHTMSSAGITARLDVLERAGLAARSRDSRDRRGVLVTLTKPGLKLVKEAAHALHRRQAFVIDVYSDRERKQVLSLLKRMLSSLERTGSQTTLPAYEAATAPWVREFPTTDPWLVEFLLVVALLTSHINRETERLLHEHQLSQTAFFILAALRRASDGHRLSPRDLSQAAVLSSAGMTAQLDQLEARALVQRSPHPNDRRGIHVTLTRGGQKLVDQAVGTYLAGHERLVSALSSSERQQLDALLRKLLVVLEGSDDDTPARATDNGRAPRETRKASPPSPSSRQRRRG